MAERYQVIIVGGGPVGVGLAVELGLRGISCCVVERHLEPQQIPKGQNLIQRTLEHFYFWGIEDELRAARVLPHGYPLGGVTAYRNMMDEYWYVSPDWEQVRSYYFTRADRMPQYALEGVLRKRMAGLDSVDALFGWTVQQIEQDDGGVRVSISETGAGSEARYEWEGFQDAARASGGEGTRVLEADFVVGCDGARSIVREQAGIRRRGSDFEQKMLLALFRSRELHDAFERFPQRTTYRALAPELDGYWMFFGRVDVGESWFFHAPVPLDTTTDNYDFQALLNKAAGFEFQAEFDHVGFWDLRVSVADEYRAGRVLIAGDAAHSHPPYGGFGLNNGLEDVRNLGWKLAAYLEDWGSDALLDSYGQERRPIFWETGEDFIASRIRSEGELLHRVSPEKDRAEFEREWEAFSKWSPIGEYEPNYEGSPVIFGPPGGVNSAHGKHTLSARAGHHLSPAALSTGRNVFEELNAGFTLLAFGDDGSADAAFRDAARTLGVPLNVVNDTFDGGREAYEVRLILVRPDHYVVWTADAAPADAAAILRRAIGAS